MLGIVGIIAFLTVLGLSLVVTRLATVALKMTGLSHDAARFQARSAFTGTGFTTSEAETVVNHPVRRRIIMLLMIMRSAGLVTIIISLILSFAGTNGEGGRLYRLLFLCGGVLIFWTLVSSSVVDRGLTRVLNWALERWTELDTRDYAGLLNLTGSYGVMELEVRDGDWLEGKRLRDLHLNQEGVVVLGITRTTGDYVGAPKGETKLYGGDRLVLYGRSRALHQLDQRRADSSGDEAHRQAIDEQQQQIAEQDRREAAHARQKEEQRRKDAPTASEDPPRL